MLKIYTDASFDWTSTNKSKDNFVRGKISIVYNDVKKIEEVVVGKVDGLKQYINIMELIGIARAIEIVSAFVPSTVSLQIFSDSRTAVAWASNAKIKKKVATIAHQNALDYLKKVRKDFGGIITFNFIPREYNLAGHLLEEELDSKKDATN